MQRGSDRRSNVDNASHEEFRCIIERERKRVLTNTVSIMEEQRQRGDEKYNSARRIVERGVLYGRLDHVDLKRP